MPEIMALTLTAGLATLPGRAARLHGLRPSSAHPKRMALLPANRACEARQH